MRSHSTIGKTSRENGKDVRRNWFARPHELAIFTARLAALLVLLVLTCRGAWAQPGPGGQTQYTYTIYFENTNNWSSVYVSVWDPNDWTNYIYYVQEQQIYYDSTVRKYVCTFTTTTELSSNVLVWFWAGDWSDQSQWGMAFQDGATYNPSGIVVDGAYKFYFDYTSIWWGSLVSAVVYYYDGRNQKVYCLGSETYGTVTWAEGTLVADNIYAWAFDTEIPDGTTAYVEITAWGDDSKSYTAWSVSAVFVNGHVYMSNNAHYPYDTFYYDEYYDHNQTNGVHTGVNVSTVNVAHKDPKWSGSVDSSRDTFNKDVKRVDSYGGGLTDLLQAANTYVDTLYVLKGSTTQLTLPYTLGGGVAANAYQRWFDFRTDGNYRYGDYDDLLRPHDLESNSGWNSIYRFANGYVCGSTDSQSRSDVSRSNVVYAMDFYYPTDDEFNGYTTRGTDGYLQQTDNNFYIVACDVSAFADCSWNDNSSVYTEPTLSGRALYYIVGVDATSTTAPNGLPSDLQTMWRLREEGYSNGGDNYLEEYDIVFPARRTSNNTMELVTLSKDASSYIVPGVGDSPASLTASISGETNGFSLVTEVWDDETSGMVPPLTGERRVLQFYNTNGDTNGTGAPWKVSDGTELTILVTKTIGGGPNATTYNIARYHLTFKDDATPLTQTQVAGLNTTAVNNSNYWWKDMTYRQPSYMNKNYNKIASLTFDYGSTSDVSAFDNEAQGGFHYFPMDWENTSYAFYDGSTGVVGDGYDWYAPGTTEYDQGNPTRKIYTQWSMYSLVNVYIGYGDSRWITETGWVQEDPTDDNSPWVEVTYYNEGNPLRPSEKPQGQEDDYWLYIDASDRPGSVAEISFDDPICVGTQVFGTALIKSASEPTSDDAAVLFSIVGVDDDGNHTTIYSQCSSQIRMTTYLNNSAYGADEVDENGLSGDITGKGSEKNEWFQLYFSFYSTERQNFDHYALKIDNYCSSTSGGDYYFDDIELYVVQPTFIVEQIAPVCTSDEQVASAMRLMVDFEMLEARLGDTMDEANKSETDTDFDTVDFMIIDMIKYDNYFSENTGASQEDVDDVAAAIEASVVQFVFKDSNGDNQSANYATLNFYVDDEYSEYPIYDVSNAGDNNAALDGSGYFFLYTVDGDEYLAIDCFADISPYRPYKILLLHDTEDMTNENYAQLFAACIDDKCEIASDFYLTSSTILKINGEAADPTVDYCAGQTVVIQPEVTYTDEEGNTVTVKGEYFDWFFGTEEEYTAVNETYGVSLEEALLMFREYYPTATELSATDTPVKGESETDFTQNMYDIIEYYLGQTNDGSYHARLVLYQQYFDVVIPTPELDLVVQPIEVVAYDEEGGQIDVCFGYVPLTLSVNGNAPTFNAGFHNVEYPGDDFVPNIRLGLSQVTQASQAKSGSNTQTPIYVNLRNAKYYADESEEVVDHLGVYTSDDGTMNGLYLVGTDDPAYEEELSDEYFLQYDLPIGKVIDLYAIENDTEGESYMQIAFYNEYTLREGYSYIVMVNCEEKDQYGASVNGVCQGTLPIEIKVVPEYLVWTGDSTSNWNNDSNWQRADRSDIHKTAEATDDDPYPTNATNETDNGFVPMLFSKVILPRDSEAELYMAGFIAGTGNILSWQGDESTADHGDVEENPTDNIMYDLMAYENATQNTLKTEHYRVNLCDQIHFEPGAQLLHAEQLIYNKAWTDVELAQGPWTLVSTPLNGVVSGDWYTKSATGTETAEYFTDITFDDENNRLNPMVYQRNWSNSGNTIVYSSGTDKTVPAYASTGWSSVYNDVSVSHQAGEGFSIKASRALPVSSADSLMFRFPKADGSYTYQGGSGTATISRGNAGQLLISGLVSRTVDKPDNDDDDDVYTGTVNIGLTQTGNGYYIIGNPFTAPMSMKQFMTENPQFVGYWTEATYGPVVGTKDGTSWGTEDCLIEPYSAFFVTTDESDITTMDATPVSVTFTKDMQTFSKQGELSHPLVSSQTAFSIRAKGEGGTTSASIAYADKATDDYRAGEDAVLMEDASWKREGMPLVYSVAGDKAVSVNSLKSLALIPIGAFADEGSLYTLSFVGVDMLDEPVLVDTYEDTETPLTEGFTLEVDGPTHGRYFIRVNTPIMTDIEEKESPVLEVSAYSPVQRTVVVSSDAGLENVELYSVGGILLKRANVGGSLSCTINGVASGIAIVRVRTAEGTTVKKIWVR